MSLEVNGSILLWRSTTNCNEDNDDQYMNAIPGHKRLGNRPRFLGCPRNLESVAGYPAGYAMPSWHCLGFSVDFSVTIPCCRLAGYPLAF